MQRALYSLEVLEALIAETLARPAFNIVNILAYDILHTSIVPTCQAVRLCHSVAQGPQRTTTFPSEESRQVGGQRLLHPLPPPTPPPLLLLTPLLLLPFLLLCPRKVRSFGSRLLPCRSADMKLELRILKTHSSTLTTTTKPAKSLEEVVGDSKVLLGNSERYNSSPESISSSFRFSSSYCCAFVTSIPVSAAALVILYRNRFKFLLSPGEGEDFSNRFAPPRVKAAKFMYTVSGLKSAFST